MAQRTVALCDGKYIGIETIYTIINGKQINIPDKLKELRNKSRNNQLYCPCGCGINLILVAGDKNLREQHFREKTGSGNYECNMPIEGKVSIDSKIVLKCWLDEKLGADDIQSRVPIDTVENTKRKPEFTFLSIEKKLAIRYWNTRANIIDDRLDVLDGNLSGIKVVYVVDEHNGGTDGQYPEALMKIQDRQGYCLLLSIKGTDYNKATIKGVFYDRDIDGIWKEIVFVNDKLNEFSIENNEIVYADEDIEKLLSTAKIDFIKDKEIEKERREEQERQHAEYLQKILEENETRRQKYLLDQEKKKQNQAEEDKKQVIEFSKKIELQMEKEYQQDEKIRSNRSSDFEQQEIQVRDSAGNRWIRCEFCGKEAKEKEFSVYGGVGRINLGTCKECFANNPAVKDRVKEDREKRKQKIDPNKCPECGGVLKEKTGKYGLFMGCVNYPLCRYTKNIRK